MVCVHTDMFYPFYRVTDATPAIAGNSVVVDNDGNILGLHVDATECQSLEGVLLYASRGNFGLSDFGLPGVYLTVTEFRENQQLRNATKAIKSAMVAYADEVYANNEKPKRVHELIEG